MRSRYHIERDFETIPMNFLWLKYHQIRFVSFGIWFLGLFLTDFTSIVNNPTDGFNEVMDYIQIISILHISFILMFFLYLFFRLFADLETEAPTLKMIIHSLFDLSIHLDIGSLLFISNFNNMKDSLYIIEILILFDVFLTYILTPFKGWRGLIGLFGVLPSILLYHYSFTKKISHLLIFSPLCISLFIPLLFSIFSLSFTNQISQFSISLIKRFDPSLLPNLISIPIIKQQNDIILDHQSSVIQTRTEQPPLIQERATSGSDFDYFDFKSIPFTILSTFLFHYSCFLDGVHKNTMIIMGHYFLSLASILINTRVVAFPAIILTNVEDPTIQFNSVWPELSFV